MLRRRSTEVGAEDWAEVLGMARWEPAGMVAWVAPGWKGWRPRGVSTMTLKWPVKGGPIAPGLVSGSIYCQWCYDTG